MSVHSMSSMKSNIISCNLLFKGLRSRRKYFLISNRSEIRRFCCVKCEDILIEPHQSQCGCRFCDNCVNDYIKEGSTNCPGCNTCYVATRDTFSFDRAAEREIMNLSLRCVNDPCDFVCKLRHLDEHLGSCEYKMVMCDLCKEMYTLMEGLNHKDSLCSMIIKKCGDCGEEMTKKVLDNEHRNIEADIKGICAKWIDVCPLGCSGEGEYNIKEHLGVCVNVLIVCPMEGLGCKKRLKRKLMEDHVSLNSVSHLSLLMNELIQYKQDKVDMALEFMEYNKKQRLEVDLWKESLASQSAELTILTESIAVCERNFLNLENEAKSLRGLNKVGGEKFGEYTWRVNNIIEKIEDAKKGVNVQILSEAFYSDVRGYKMFLKIYPNGDGLSRGSSLSIYFVLAKGDYDNSITWPFNHRISISLRGNRPGISDRTVNMRPDNNSSCYGKPVQRLNLAAGTPNFISHSELKSTNQYIEGNSITVFAKII